MNKQIDYLTTGITFSSFIALNRYMDKEILKDSKLLTLMIYIALRVKRSNQYESNNWSGIKLEIGEFIIGRPSTLQDTDLTEAEYKSRLGRLKRLNIITNLEPTNRFTKGKWVENSFINLNLEIPIDQPIHQQNISNLTTNNNINNSNKDISSLINSFNNTPYSSNDYEKVINEYMRCKGIELKGNEIKDALVVIKSMFDSQRSVEDITKFMQWLKKIENYEEYPNSLKNWSILTVRYRIPEFLAGKLRIPELGDDLPDL